MASESRLHEVIDRIYEVALDPAQWTGALREVGALIGAPQGSLMVGSLAQQAFTDFGYGRNEEAIRLYNTRFSGQDPWFEPLERLGAGVVATGQELFPTKQFEQTPYYEECLRLDETYDCLAVILERQHRFNAFVAFQRPEFLPVFGEEEKRLLAVLFPHLKRVVQIHRQFERFYAMNSLQTVSLDRLSFGVAIVTSGRHIHFANRAAHMIAGARDGLRFTSNGLIALHPEDNARLTAAQDKALAPRANGKGGPAGSTLAISRPSMKRPYTVQVMPIATSDTAFAKMFRGPTRFALIAIVDPDANPASMDNVLIQAYRLTPAEAAVAVRIGSGLSPGEVADALGITLETVRSHLKKVLAKTETNRQAQLASLLAAIGKPLAES